MLAIFRATFRLKLFLNYKVEKIFDGYEKGERKFPILRECPDNFEEEEK